jgi:hypothetical protein
VDQVQDRDRGTAPVNLHPGDQLVRIHDLHMVNGVALALRIVRDHHHRFLAFGERQADRGLGLPKSTADFLATDLAAAKLSRNHGADDVDGRVAALLAVVDRYKRVRLIPPLELAKAHARDRAGFRRRVPLG